MIGARPDPPRQDFGGVLAGITAHLGHFAVLRVGPIYLTPFVPSESPQRYNASTFAAVEPLLGGDAAMARLAAAAGSCCRAQRRACGMWHLVVA